MGNRVGYMQGRLSPMVGDKIQAFPWDCWQDEFRLAREHDFGIMEWTLDDDRLHENPLMTDTGREGITRLQSQYNLEIPSLTGDCFMQSPFYRASGNRRSQLLDDFKTIVRSCQRLGIGIIVMPMVDKGRITGKTDERDLKEGLKRVQDLLEEAAIQVSFESDFPPHRLAEFIDEYKEDCFGVNYDIGNSASLGYDVEDEIRLYGHRIINVHVKDRMFQGATVPLGEGDARLPETISELRQIGYAGNFILQTARAKDGDHVGVLKKYQNQVIELLDVSGE